MILRSVCSALAMRQSFWDVMSVVRFAAFYVQNNTDGGFNELSNLKKMTCCATKGESQYSSFFRCFEKFIPGSTLKNCFPGSTLKNCSFSPFDVPFILRCCICSL